MKFLKHILMPAAIALAMSAVSSCAEPDEDFLHKDSSIRSIEIQPAESGASIAGYIDETTGEIFFPIPKKFRDKYDVTSLMVRASVEYDTFIYPPLSGLKDLSDPMEITVVAGDKSWRKYTLWAFYTRR